MGTQEGRRSDLWNVHLQSRHLVCFTLINMHSVDFYFNQKFFFLGVNSCFTHSPSKEKKNYKSSLMQLIAVLLYYWDHPTSYWRPRQTHVESGFSILKHFWLPIVSLTLTVHSHYNLCKTVLFCDRNDHPESSEWRERRLWNKKIINYKTKVRAPAILDEKKTQKCIKYSNDDRHQNQNHKWRN